MQPTRFVVEGAASGYTTTNRAKKGQKHKVSKAILKYWAYCDRVRLRAKEAGLRKLPLQPSKEQPLMFFTRCYFKSGVHPDPENVHKGVKDALCYQRGGGTADKYTGGGYLPPEYDAQNPRVEVIVRPMKEKDKEEWDS
jgi:hypothetical protein